MIELLVFAFDQVRVPHHIQGREPVVDTDNDAGLSG